MKFWDKNSKAHLLLQARDIIFNAVILHGIYKTIFNTGNNIHVTMVMKKNANYKSIQ